MPYRAILVLAALCWPAGLCRGADVDPALGAGLARQEFLEAEFSLAQKPQFYVVFDFQARAVLLKARGTVFRQWSAAEPSGLWGEKPPVGPLVLTERHPGLAVQRVIVKPPEGGAKDGAAASDSAAPAPPDALEVGDMPARYRLLFGDAMLVSISPRPVSFAGRAGAFARAVLRQGLLPPRALWNRLRGRTAVEVDLVLDDADARALYWAFSEGMSALFRYPAE